jgi:hypothetical protein
LSKYLSTELIKLKWYRCPDGYEILSINPNKDLIDKNEIKKSRLQKLFEVKHSVISDHRQLEYSAISPLSDKVETVYPLKKNTEIITEFANLFNPETFSSSNIVLFANNYGLISKGIVHITGMRTHDDISLWRENSLYVRQVINHYLTNKKPMKAIELYNIGIQSLKIAPNVNLAPRETDRFISFQAQDLFSGMWLLLGGILSSGIDLKMCEYKGCNNWFKANSKKRFCCEQCRIYAHRIKNKA